MYFSFFKLKKWGKKTAETRRRNCAVLSLIPMAYWREKGLPRGGKVSQTDPYKWCKSTVEKILRQQEYCGDT